MTICSTKLRKTEKRKSGIAQSCAKLSLRMIAQSAIFSRKNVTQKSKSLRFLSQKLRKSFSNGNPKLEQPYYLFNSLSWLNVLFLE